MEDQFERMLVMHQISTSRKCKSLKPEPAAETEDFEVVTTVIVILHYTSAAFFFFVFLYAFLYEITLKVENWK